MVAQRSFNGLVNVGAPFAVVSSPLSLSAGPYVLIAKLYATPAGAGAVSCELREGGVTLDFAATYLAVDTVAELPIALVSTVTLATPSSAVQVVCQAPDGGAAIRAVQLVAIRVNLLDAPN